MAYARIFFFVAFLACQLPLDFGKLTKVEAKMLVFKPKGYYSGVAATTKQK